MKRKNRRMILVFLCIFTLIALSGIAAANPILITQNQYNQYLQSMDEQHVVYTDSRAGDLDIWMYDIQTGDTTRITYDLSDQFDPDVSGNYVVFSDRRHADADIYLSDIRSGVSKDLTDFLIGDQLLAKIDGDYVVWTDFGALGGEVYLYKISTGIAQDITNAPGNQQRPAISGNFVVFEDDRNGNSDIYLYDISNGQTKQITDNPRNQRKPAISGWNIVYEEYQYGNGDVFLYNITTGLTTEVTIDPSQQADPDISGSTVVYSSDQDSIGDIMMYDISTGLTTALTKGEYYERNPSVAGNYISYEKYEQFPGPNPDANIWLYTLNQPPVAEAGSDQTVHLGEIVQFDGSGSYDPDGTIVSYWWHFGDSHTSGEMSPTNLYGSEGTWIARLDVYDNGGLYDTDDCIITVLPALPPVADAGPDQSVVTLGSIIHLDGTQSYDPAGTSFTYLWTITRKPAGSAAALSDPTSSKPTFVADKQGEYGIALEVTNFYGASSTDDVVVSFNNVKPVADAGVNQVVAVGTTVSLDGSSSNDANGDTLTYHWSIVSKPVGSGATLTTPLSVTPTFKADKAGTYEISLVVNDGLVNSDSSPVTVTATANSGSVITEVAEAIDAINGLDPLDFKNANMQNTLTNKLAAVIKMVEKGQYAEAINKLQNDILQKTDGCAQTGAPDNNDWIRDCTAQQEIYPQILSIIEQLRGLL